MPKDLENEIELYADRYEVPLDISELAWPYMISLLYCDKLYTGKEIYYALKRNEFDRVLVDTGHPRLNLVDRSVSTSMQVILHNLWRQPCPRVRKFFNGRWGNTGQKDSDPRPEGVRWMLTEGRVEL